jgi:hypothetical protein
VFVQVRPNASNEADHATEPEVKSHRHGGEQQKKVGETSTVSKQGGDELQTVQEKLPAGFVSYVAIDHKSLRSGLRVYLNCHKKANKASDNIIDSSTPVMRSSDFISTVPSISSDLATLLHLQFLEGLGTMAKKTRALRTSNRLFKWRFF